MLHRFRRNDVRLPLWGNSWLPQGRASALLVLVILIGGCRAPANQGRIASPTALTIGVGQVIANPQFGMQQVAALLSLEGLAIVGGDGKSRPLLAAGWNLSNDGRVLKIQLRPSVVFHDQAPVDSQAVRSVLERELKKAL